MLDVVTRKGKVTANNPNGKPSPTQKEFVSHYLSSSSRNELVENLKKSGFHMTYNAASARIKNYTQQGCKLPPYKPQKRGRRVDVDSINAMVLAHKSD
jgi:hypothetical protein